MLLVLLAVLGVLLFRSFLPGLVLFSNDGPLGRLVSASHRLPDIFTGAWQDLNIVGLREGGAFPNITSALRLVLGPIVFAKFYAPLAMLLLGFAAWYFFRQLKLVPLASLLGGLAATLNSSFFSAACWGVASHTITVAMIFLAMAALTNDSAPRSWLRVALAGFAVGMAVSEGADIGALFSLLVGVFIFYGSWVKHGLAVRAGAFGLSRLALVAVCAAMMAAQAVSVLVGTQIQGVTQTSRTPQEQWDWATQWSLPKRETLSLVVPGLFGYLMDSPDGASYWGAAGRAPALDKYYQKGKQGPPPKGYRRFVGGGFYAGVLVVMLAIWATLHGWLKRDPLFNGEQRRWIWFWSVIALVSLLLAFGRFAPFYHIIYALPYFSTIRNPVKFLHILSMGLVVLFAYGVDGLWRTYSVRKETAAPMPAKARTKASALRCEPLDRYWLWGCLVLLVLSLGGWLVYAAQRQDLQSYLLYMDFTDDMAQAIASFSVRQVCWFMLFFILGLGFMALMCKGTFTGKNARYGLWLLGFLLVADLARANLPWIRYVNYPQEYSSNVVLEVLRPKPWNHRVAILPAWFEEPWFVEEFHLPPSAAEMEFRIRKYYEIELVEHLFPFYNVQSLDVAQLPRLPNDLGAYQETFKPHNNHELGLLLARQWELTNTRYLVGLAELEGFLNTHVDPSQRRIRVVQRFDFAPKPNVLAPKQIEDLTVVPTPEGKFALFEFAGALPRAMLYSKWQVVTNDPANLKILAAPGFAPDQTVLVSQQPGPVAAWLATNSEPGNVQFESYAPKNIVLRAENASAAVLLLNDRFDPNWNVMVDGRRAPLLRCNFLMRGVYLEPGKHTVQFTFHPPVRALYVSITGIAVALLLLGTLIALDRRTWPATDESPSRRRRSIRVEEGRTLSPRGSKA
jgi:hypothetical protein